VTVDCSLEADGSYIMMLSKSELPVVPRKVSFRSRAGSYESAGSAGNASSEVLELQQTVDSYENRLAVNKRFLYMVIHDLKHPSNNISFNLTTSTNSLTAKNMKVGKIKKGIASLRDLLLKQLDFTVETKDSDFQPDSFNGSSDSDVA